jgi:hypothetical protein
MPGVALRYIFDSSDTLAWQASSTHTDFLRFLGALLQGVEGKASSSKLIHVSPLMTAVESLLSEAGSWLSEYPPIAQPMRFGNKAFRLWHARLVQEAPRLCRTLGSSSSAVTRAHSYELASYLVEAFGNPTRLDYGTGHETSFAVFLYALGRAGLLTAADAPALGLRVFPAYIRLARAVQRAYGLEPAGSHGVWTVDDYFLLTFMIGAAQLKGGAQGSPSALLDTDTRDSLRSDFLYADALAAICQVKHGAPFAEHSPMLHELAGLSTWGKLTDSLAKLYKVEVLGKMPVAQHFLFGDLFPAEWVPSRTPVPLDSGVALANAAAAEEGGELRGELASS